MPRGSLAAVRGSPGDSGRVVVVLAGPNGAGKSTFFDTWLAATGLPFVNADLIARALCPHDPGAVAYEAAARADTERRRLAAAGESFCMETVFSDPAGEKVAFLRELQDAGYAVNLVFIGLESPELSIARVMQRVEDGGHDVPDDRLRARYPRTLANLRAAVKFADHAILFDNSAPDAPYRHVATVARGRLQRKARQLPAWARKALEGLHRPPRLVRAEPARRNRAPGGRTRP